MHQEEDIGIDGVIELVRDGQSTGLWVAIQVKAGESFVKKDEFVVRVKQAHLRYWQSLNLPVVLICYSPAKQKAAWRSVNRYIELQRRQSDGPIKSIKIPFRNIFNEGALTKGLYGVALESKDKIDLLNAAELTLSDDVSEREKGLFLLGVHPASRSTRLTAYLASQLILDENLETVRLAAKALGFCIAQNKWDVPLNYDMMFYAQRLCFKFGEPHFKRLMESIDDGDFGRMSVGEACADCIKFMQDGEAIARKIALDTSIPIQTRVNTLGLFYNGDYEAVLSDEAVLCNDGLGDLVDWLIERMPTLEHKS